MQNSADIEKSIKNLSVRKLNLLREVKDIDNSIKFLLEQQKKCEEELRQM